MKMLLLPGLLFILWGEPAPGRCLEQSGNFEFSGDIRQFAVATDMVYIATEEKLYQLKHDLTPVRSVTQRGVLRVGDRVENARFHRVSDTDDWNATFSINVLLPFVENGTLISCGVTDNECGYCELLDLRDISNVIYRETIEVGPPRKNGSASVGFLVNVEETRTRTETYILTATQQQDYHSTRTSCSTGLDLLNLFNTNNVQNGGIFSFAILNSGPPIKPEGKVEFVDGFQIDLIIYLFSNLPSTDGSNKVRLLWFEGKKSKRLTFKSLRGATLSISDDAPGSRLLTSSVIPGGLPVLWSGVFSVDGEQTQTELAVFDISPDLTLESDKDPDFCSTPPCADKSKPPALKPKTVLLKQNYMTSVLSVRQKAWMVFFVGTGDGQLIKLTVDKNFHAACPRVLYRANDDRKVFPTIHLDPVDHKHVYVPFKNQMKRVPVSTCSTHTSVQDCWSAQDPYCVWCSSKSSCTFDDECRNSDWLSISEDFQKKMVSHRLVKDGNGQVALNIQTHVIVGPNKTSNFACSFSSTCANGPPPQFPQCTCILENSILPAEGMHVSVRIRLETTVLSEQFIINDCADIKGPPTSALCQQCIEAGCGWSSNGCSWANHQGGNDGVCQMMELEKNISRPEIFSISPNVVSFYGRNHVVLSGRNLSSVTRVRIRADMDCSPQESAVWNNTGASLMFHIPSADNKGVVKVCVLLPDGTCHGNAEITYQSSPSCISITPNRTWISGKRKVILTGSHLEFVEGIKHSHTRQEVRFSGNEKNQNPLQELTYETPAAENNGNFMSNVSLKVVNETLACSMITYYPDPEFTSFETTRTGDDVLVTIQKKADKLEMTQAELSVWGVHEGKEYPCNFQKDKDTSNKTNFFICEIKMTPEVTFQQIKIKYGGKTVRLGPPAVLNRVLQILRLLLIPCVTVVLVVVCRWQKKLTADKNEL